LREHLGQCGMPPSNTSWADTSALRTTSRTHDSASLKADAPPAAFSGREACCHCPHWATHTPPLPVAFPTSPCLWTHHGRGHVLAPGRPALLGCRRHHPPTRLHAPAVEEPSGGTIRLPTGTRANNRLGSPPVAGVGKEGRRHGRTVRFLACGAALDVPHGRFFRALFIDMTAAACGTYRCWRCSAPRTPRAGVTAALPNFARRRHTGVASPSRRRLPRALL